MAVATRLSQTRSIGGPGSLKIARDSGNRTGPIPGIYGWRSLEAVLDGPWESGSTKSGLDSWGIIRVALHDEDTCLNVGVLMQASLFILHRVID